MSITRALSRFRRPGQCYGAIIVAVGLDVLLLPIAATFIIFDQPSVAEKPWASVAYWLSKYARIGAFIGIPLTLAGLLLIGFTRTDQEKSDAKKQAWKTLRQQTGNF